MKYAEAMGHFATLAKMIEEEMSVGRASRDLDEKLIQVILFHGFNLPRYLFLRHVRTYFINPCLCSSVLSALALQCRHESLSTKVG